MATRRTNRQGVPTDVVEEINEQEVSMETTPELAGRTATGKKNLVMVEFNVDVPVETDMLNRSVFLAGTLHQLSNRFSDWDPHGLEMSQIDKNRWSIALEGPENATIEYKYTLGSWDHVEKGATCQEIANRRVTLKRTSTDLQIMEDTVKAWRDEGKCPK